MNQYLKFSYFTTINSLPGIFSIILSLISIPIFLKKLDYGLYGIYLIQHIFLSLGYIINLGINKLILISSSKKLISKKSDNFTACILTLIISIIFSLIIMVIMKSVNLFFKFQTLDFLFNIYTFMGLIITSVYITFESIFKSEMKYVYINFSNFIFFGLSISLPAFFIFFQENFEILNFNDASSELFQISLICKILSITILVFFIKKLNLFQIKISQKFIILFKKNYKSFSILEFLATTFEYIDRAAVKIFFGNDNLAIYSTSQQIASKSTIFSKAFISYFLPLISKNKQKKNISYLNVYDKAIFFIFVIGGLGIYIIQPFSDIFFQFWLSEKYLIDFSNIFKILIIAYFFYTLSIINLSVLESRFETSKISKIEIIYLFVHIVLLVLLSNQYNPVSIAIVYLVKEMFFVLLRYFYLNKFYKVRYETFYFLTLFLILNLLNYYYWSPYIYITGLIILILNLLYLKKNVFRKI